LGFGPRRDIAFPMLGDGIFTQEGSPWKHSRELVRPQFVHKQYKNLEVFREAVNDFLDAIPKDSEVIDLQPFFFRFTLDTTTTFLFGESAKALRQPVSANEPPSQLPLI
jgi:cytochrome P450